jgi:hypothetical protein
MWRIAAMNKPSFNKQAAAQATASAIRVLQGSRARGLANKTA